MSNITEAINAATGEVSVIIDNGDGSFTSMLKSTWDEQQKAAELGGTL